MSCARFMNTYALSLVLKPTLAYFAPMPGHPKELGWVPSLGSCFDSIIAAHCCWLEVACSLPQRSYERAMMREEMGGSVEDFRRTHPISAFDTLRPRSVVSKLLLVTVSLSLWLCESSSTTCPRGISQRQPACKPKGLIPSKVWNNATIKDPLPRTAMFGTVPTWTNGHFWRIFLRSLTHSTAVDKLVASHTTRMSSLPQLNQTNSSSQHLTPLPPQRQNNPNEERKEEHKQQEVEYIPPVTLKCLENKEIAKEFICGICNCLAVEPTELTCKIHMEDPNLDSIPIYCRKCLAKFVKEKGVCPLTNHSKPYCSPSASRVQRTMANLIIFCPNGDQFRIECFSLFFFFFSLYPRSVRTRNHIGDVGTSSTPIIAIGKGNIAA